VGEKQKRCGPSSIAHRTQKFIWTPLVGAAIIIDGEGAGYGFATMPFARRFIPRKPPIGQRRCPACGHLMFLASIEPSDQTGRDQRTYECVECAFAETETVQFA